MSILYSQWTATLYFLGLASASPSVSPVSFMGFSFAQPLYLVLALAVLPIFWLASRRRKALGHSQVGIHKNLRSMPLVGWIPNLLLVAIWIALACAMARPLLPETKTFETIQTRDFVITTDISGSMDSQISDPDQLNFAGGDTTAAGEPAKVRKIDVAAKAIKVFVAERQGDRVALLVFDDETYYYWPLSRDIRVVERKADRVNKYTRGGTNFDSEKGAIQGALNHFKELGTAKTKVLIMVTDGESTISKERFEALTKQLVEMNVKFYILGVGESWVNGSTMTQDLRRLVEGVGGTVIPIGDAAQLRAAFATINNLEKSQVQVEKSVTYRDIYEYFIGAAVLFAALYLLAAALVREDA